MPTDEDSPAVPPPLPTRHLSRQIRIGQTLNLSLGIWFRNVVPFFIIAVLVHSPLLILAALLLAVPVGSDEWLTFERVERMLGFFILGQLVTGAVTFAVVEGLRGRRAGLGRCLSLAVGRLPVLVLVAAVVGAPSLLSSVLDLCGAGLEKAPAALLSIVALVLYLCFFVAAPVVMVERPGYFGLAALKRSAVLTAGNRWRILGLMIVMGLIVFGVAMVVGVVLVVAQRSFEDVPRWLDYCIRQGLGLLALPLFSVMQAVVYYDLRMRRDGVDLDEIVGVFD